MVSGAGINRSVKKTGKAKEKIFHPNSRKAGQLERTSLRKSKLATASTKRSKRQIEKADSVGFWFYALPPDALTLTLEEIHALIGDVWLPRYDESILAEESLRRKGRPPSKREVELRGLKVQAEHDYRSGIELPDLTHERTVELFREWNGDPAYLHLLRFIRVSSSDLTSVPIVRHGLQEREKASEPSHPMDVLSTKDDYDDAPHAMAVEVNSDPGVAEQQPSFIPGFPDIPASQFSSTMLTMDS